MGTIIPVKPNGDVPIPSDVRKRLQWDGSRLVMEQVGRTVILRREHDVETADVTFDWDAFRRHHPRWDGPPASRADIRAAVDRMFAERGRP